jgi:hypothetical protein
VVDPLDDWSAAANADGEAREVAAEHQAGDGHFKALERDAQQENSRGTPWRAGRPSLDIGPVFETVDLDVARQE